MISAERLEELLGGFGDLEIGLVGDLFLDRYLDINPTLAETSVETGLEALQVTRVRNSPGALGTIICNLAALGVRRLVPVSVIGDDGEAYDLIKALAALPVDTAHVIRDPSRMTPTYTKPMKPDARGKPQELNRLDLRSREPISPDAERQAIEHLERVFHESDGLIVQDQITEEGWGVMNPNVRARLKQLAANETGKLVFVDSRAHVARFDFGVLKPNLAECLAAVGRASGGESEAREAACELASRTGRTVFCTQGAEGMLVVAPGVEPVEVPGFPVDGPTDIVGAGDAATAGIVTAKLTGASDVEAAELGNLTASITVQKLGTTGTATGGRTPRPAA